MNNPYDLLDLPAALDADALQARLRAALADAAPRLRADLEEALAALERDPDTRLAWLLTSRCGGALHPWDDALRAPPPPLPLVSIFRDDSTPDRIDRARQVAELVDLPALDHPPPFADGIAPRRGTSKDEDPP